MAIKADGVYIDSTFGRGGHSREILARLGNNGNVIAFDKDIEAVMYANNTIQDSRFLMIHASFATLMERLRELSINQVDGVLLDLGVSSP